MLNSFSYVVSAEPFSTITNSNEYRSDSSSATIERRRASSSTHSSSLKAGTTTEMNFLLGIMDFANHPGALMPLTGGPFLQRGGLL
jgi:hypothetical protein